MVSLCLIFGVVTLQGTNIPPKNGILKMIFLFPRWDMLISWRVLLQKSFFLLLSVEGMLFVYIVNVVITCCVNQHLRRR